MAGPEGIEPSFSLLERDVLPLNYGPMILARLWYIAFSFLATLAVYVEAKSKFFCRLAILVGSATIVLNHIF